MNKHKAIEKDKDKRKTQKCIAYAPMLWVISCQYLPHSTSTQCRRQMQQCPLVTIISFSKVAAVNPSSNPCSRLLQRATQFDTSRSLYSCNHNTSVQVCPGLFSEHPKSRKSRFLNEITKSMRQRDSKMQKKEERKIKRSESFAIATLLLLLLSGF